MPNTSALDGETLSKSLIGLFERRYLSNLKLSNWKIKEGSSDKFYEPILLKKVLELGKVQDKEDIKAVLPNVLHACQEKGHSLVMLLSGQGTHQEIYLGGKRTIGRANTSSSVYVESVESSFKSYYTGLKMSKPFELASISNVYNSIANAPCLSVITGIPSIKHSSKVFSTQSLDKLAKAAANSKYNLMIVAQPIPAEEVDTIVDRLRDLKGEIHSLKRISYSEQIGTSYSKSISMQDIDLEEKNLLGTISSIGKSISYASHFLPGAGIVTGLIGMGLTAISNKNLEKLQTENKTISSSESKSKSNTISKENLNAHAEFCEKLIDEHLERLLTAKSNGWWQTGVYLTAEDEVTLARVVGAYKSICTGDDSKLDPIRTINLPNGIIRKHILSGNIIKANLKGNLFHPLGSYYDSFSTCLNSKELSGILHLPIGEIPGIRFKNFAEYSKNPSKETCNSENIFIGNIENDGEVLQKIDIQLKSLNRHLFISGMTGGGKSNTCLQILNEAYTKHNIPFLVIDPVKSDYSQLLTIEELRSKIKVFSVGITSDIPLKINPFQLLSWSVCLNNPKFLSKHLEYLKAIFTASFPNLKEGPFASIIENSLEVMYREKGWNINFSTNKWLSKEREPSEQEWLSVMPNVNNFSEAIEFVMNQKKYRDDTQKDIREALMTRIRGLLIGNKGAVFNQTASTDFDLLFNEPCIVEIKDLADNDDKSLIMSFLFTFLYEYAEYVRGENDSLKHITIIEEAHRLLSASSPGMHGSVGAHGKSIELFSQMIAEMRGFGEGFIIADQSPQALSPQTIKNTNIKIIHRLADREDRQICGGAINLNIPQIEYLNNLEPGFAVLHDDSFDEPVLVKIHNFKNTRLSVWSKNSKNETLRLMAAEFKKIKPNYALRKSSCEGCLSPCTAFYDYDFENERTKMSDNNQWNLNEEYNKIAAFADNLLFQRNSEAFEILNDLKTQNENDLLFCKGVFYLEVWLKDWIKGREELDSDRIGPVVFEQVLNYFSETLSLFIHKGKRTELRKEAIDFFKKYYDKSVGNENYCSKCEYPCLLIGYVKTLQQNKSTIGALKYFEEENNQSVELLLKDKYKSKFIESSNVKDLNFGKQLYNCKLANT